MRRALVLQLLVLWGSICFAQDPGIPDTVSFGPWEAIVPVDSPWTGNIRVPVRVFNDEPLYYIEMVFKWDGPWDLINAKFSDDRANYFTSTYIDYDTVSNNTVLIQGIVSSWPSAPLIPADTGILAYLCFTVYDTGAAEINKSTTVLLHYLHFSYPFGEIIPEFSMLNDAIRVTDLLAGDVNNNAELALSDIIALANFVFRSSYKPPLLNLLDVNADCKTDVVDIVYLISVIFRSGFNPRWGCVC